jgi:hypothetical protein
MSVCLPFSSCEPGARGAAHETGGPQDVRLCIAGWTGPRRQCAPQVMKSYHGKIGHFGSYSVHAIGRRARPGHQRAPQVMKSYHGKIGHFGSYSVHAIGRRARPKESTCATGTRKDPTPHESPQKLPNPELSELHTLECWYHQIPQWRCNT